MRTEPNKNVCTEIQIQYVQNIVWRLCWLKSLKWTVKCVSICISSYYAFFEVSPFTISGWWWWCLSHKYIYKHKLLSLYWAMLLLTNSTMSQTYSTTCSHWPGSVTGVGSGWGFTPCWAQVFIRPATPRFILTDSELRYNVVLGTVSLSEFLPSLWSTKNGSNCTFWMLRHKPCLIVERSV